MRACGEDVNVRAWLTRGTLAGQAVLRDATSGVCFSLRSLCCVSGWAY